MQHSTKDVIVGSKWVIDEGFPYFPVDGSAVQRCEEAVAIEITQCIGELAATWKKLEGPDELPTTGGTSIELISKYGRLVGWDCGESLGNGRFSPMMWFAHKADAEAFVASQEDFVMVERPEPTPKSEAWF